MPHNRFYSPDLSTLSPDELRHLRVMRAQPGDTIELIDGLGTLALATLTSRTTFTIDSQTSFPPPSPLILAQGIPHRPRLDMIIEKGTELGATRFIFYPSARIDLPRLKRIAISALKQCGALYLPTIEVSDTLPLDLPSPAVYGSPSGPPLSSDAVSVIIGPPSGFSDEASLQAAGIRPACWNAHTLRSETAGLAALAILSSRRL